MRKRLDKYFQGVFDLNGDYRPTYHAHFYLVPRIKDFLWRTWMNLFGSTFVTSVGKAGLDSVTFWGNLEDLKVKFVKGNCINFSYAREIQAQRVCLHEGMTYTIDYGDPVRLHEMVYMGRFKPHYDTLAIRDYRFKSGNCFISFACCVGIRIVSIKEGGRKL